jgi:O-acetylhomoserine/O-acetylserine sulfhydrylase-like pyridoxal-dependent enzyme
MHRQLSKPELESVDGSPDMIRPCVGIKHIDDNLADLDEALAASV